MSDSAITVSVAAVVGAIAGAIGSFLAPWAQWGVEKRRRRLERRGVLIDCWRKLLDTPDFERGTLLDHPSYGALRLELSTEAVDQLERPPNQLLLGFPGLTRCSPDRDMLLREIARIERGWGLS